MVERHCLASEGRLPGLVLLSRVLPSFQPPSHELVLVSGGNIPLSMLNGTVYPEANEIRSVRSPGQSWDALAVGAYSENALVEENDILVTGYEPVAMPGELCPLSTTSLQ